MTSPAPLKVTATVNGHRYTASLAGDQVLILGQGQALATCRWTPEGFREMRPAALDHFVTIPPEDIGVIDDLEQQLRAALSRAEAGAQGA